MKFSPPPAKGEGDEARKGSEYKLIANIPYYITGAIFKYFLSLKNQPSNMILMVQKEVAERIVTRDGKESVEAKPMLGDKPAVSALLKGDHAALHAAGEQGINDLIGAATDGKTTEQIVENVRPLIEGGTHEKFGVPYSQAVYQPMRELLALLEANGFVTWICSGSPLLISRELSQQMFGIPPERVMGSYTGIKLDERGGKTVLVFDGTIGRLNDGEGKPVTINLAIGTRPVFVAGNEGGRGDIAMMRWSKDREGPSFQLLVNHDDADREYAYAEPDNYSLNAAQKYGFHVVSIKRDWKTVVGR